MKTSITETIRTEKFLRGELTSGEHLVYEAELVIDPRLRSNTVFHGMVHRLLRLYHRRKMKQEVQTLSDRLLRDPNKKEFREAVFKHFKS